VRDIEYPESGMSRGRLGLSPTSPDRPGALPEQLGWSHAGHTLVTEIPGTLGEDRFAAVGPFRQDARADLRKYQGVSNPRTLAAPPCASSNRHSAFATQVQPLRCVTEDCSPCAVVCGEIGPEIRTKPDNARRSFPEVRPNGVVCRRFRSLLSVSAQERVVRTTRNARMSRLRTGTSPSVCSMEALIRVVHTDVASRQRTERPGRLGRSGS
jgi:hypothetical protein